MAIPAVPQSKGYGYETTQVQPRQLRGRTIVKKRSKYRPRRIISDPVSWVISGLKPVSSSGEAVGLKIKNHQALLEITQGNGNRDSVDILIAAMNMAEALYVINANLGKDYAKEIKAAQDAIYHMGTNQARSDSGSPDNVVMGSTAGFSRKIIEGWIPFKHDYIFVSGIDIIMTPDKDIYFICINNDRTENSSYIMSFAVMTYFIDI